MSDSVLEKLLFKFEEMENKFEEMEKRFNARLEEMEKGFNARFDNLNKDITNIKFQLDNLENKFSLLRERIDFLELTNKNEMILNQISPSQSEIKYTYVHPYNSFKTARKRRVIAL